MNIEKMKLIDFRFVLFDERKVLQVRHRRTKPHWDGKFIGHELLLVSFSCNEGAKKEMEEWSDWETVPFVESAEDC
jgi:hypothetical protein